MALNKLKLGPDYIGPVLWANVAAAQTAIGYSDVTIQAANVSGTWTAKISIDGNTYVNAVVFDSLLTMTNSITSNGIYSLTGNRFVKLTGGSGGTFTILLTN